MRVCIFFCSFVNYSIVEKKCVRKQLNVWLSSIDTHVDCRDHNAITNTAKHKISLRCLQEVGLGFSVWEQCTWSSVVYPLHKWETDLWIVELFDMWTSALDGCDWFHFDDLQMTRYKNQLKSRPIKSAGNCQWIGMQLVVVVTYLNGMSTSTMTSAHIAVALCYCTTNG